MASPFPQLPVARPRSVRNAVAIAVTGAALLWSTSELVNLLRVHTTGTELYGVLAAAVAVGTAALSLALLVRTRRPAWAVIAVLALWAVVALAGIAGTVAHIVGPVPGHGPVDLRPRPVAAPLVFTALGLLGGAALSLGWRAGARRSHQA